METEEPVELPWKQVGDLGTILLGLDLHGGDGAGPLGMGWDMGAGGRKPE